MVADDRGKLYLITANKLVYKIDPGTKVITYLGAINGLPRGYSTNGAIVEQGTSIIVSSANSTAGYYKFDLKTLEAEKIESAAPVFNASDLANHTLISEKRSEQQALIPLVERTRRQSIISVFPNPAVAGQAVKVSFGEQPKGKYTVQLIDLTGKVVGSREIQVSNKVQTEEYKLPALLAKGNYLVKVVGENKLVSVNNLLVR